MKHIIYCVTHASQLVDAYFAPHHIAGDVTCDLFSVWQLYWVATSGHYSLCHGILHRLVKHYQSHSVNGFCNALLLAAQLNPEVIVIVDGPYRADVHHVSIFTVGSDWAIKCAERIDRLGRRFSHRS